MIEINYKDGKQVIKHDQKVYTIDELMNHLNSNGHERECVGYAVSRVHFNECRSVSQKIEALFDAKGLPRRISQI